MVAAPGLLDARQVLVELLLRGEGDAVDALQHRVALVATPVGARGLQQLEGADLIGALHVGPAAQVLELAVAEHRDGLAFRDVAEARHLELFSELREAPARLVAGHHLAGEHGLARDDARHLFLDARQVLGREGALHEEVVLELLAVIAAADVDLRLGEEPLHGIGHDVLGRVPDDLAAGGVLRRDDLDAGAVGQRSAQIQQAPVHAAGQRGARQPGADPLRNRERARARRERELLPVGQPNVYLAHERLDGIGVESAFSRGSAGRRSGSEMVGTGGIEPPTPTVSRWCSPTELRASSLPNVAQSISFLPEGVNCGGAAERPRAAPREGGPGRLPAPLRSARARCGPCRPGLVRAPPPARPAAPATRR